MKRGIVIGIVLLVIVVCLIILYATTGFLQHGDIDTKDIEKWTYVDGVIPKAQGFTLEGNSGECWVMIHGYTSTPDELRVVADAIYHAFNDTIYVPRLHGHGELPGHIEQYSVDDWYNQAEDLMKKHQCSYMLGSSMGASITLRYAEQNRPKGIVLLGIMLKPKPTYLPMKTITRGMYPLVRYAKKTEPAETVISPEGKKEHISTYAFPLKGTVELFDFNRKMMGDLAKVKSSVLFVHTRGDTVAAISEARKAYDEITAPKNFLELLEGNHIIMRDYGKQKAVEGIIQFRQNLS